MTNLFLFILSVIVLHLPVIGKFFKVLNTLIHESGHAIVALLFRGRVSSISLFTDTSGVARTASSSRFAAFFVSLAGYPFSSSLSYLLLYFYMQHHYELIFYIFVGFCLINLLFWVRNFYGIIWILAFSAILALLYIYPVPYEHYIILFFIFVLYSEAIAKSLVILKISFRTPNEAGDATNLRNATFIPAFFWGFIFFAQSLFFAFEGAKLFFK